MRTPFLSILCGTALMAAGSFTAQADSITIPNGSFELQSGVGQLYGVNINIDSWQKAPKPDYFTDGQGDFYWVQTAGVFVDSNPYLNRVGTQAAYLLAFAGAGLSQDLSTPFQAGMSYTFSLGLFGKGMTEGSLLGLSFYYRDDGDNMVTVGNPTYVGYSATTFPVGPSLSLIDYQVTTPVVQAGDAWAGKTIGIKIESLNGDSNGYWDMDNARLTAVPEPTSIALLALGVGGMAAARLRRRKK